MRRSPGNRGAEKTLNLSLIIKVSFKYHINQTPTIHLMPPFIYLAILTISFITSANGFNLIGEWILSTEHLDYAKSLNQTNITFNFQQQISPRNTISRNIVISACRTMFYTFTYRQNSIVPIFIRFGNNTRQCLDEQVNEIRRKMESVFYFSIVENRLILIYPSRQVVFTLFKNTSLPIQVKGNWSILELNGKKTSNDTIQVKDDKILLCGGSIVLVYKLQSGNKIRITQISNSGECKEKQGLAKAIEDSKFYSRDRNQLRLYNGNLHPTIKAQTTQKQPALTSFSKQTLHNKWYIHSINGTRLDEQTQPIYYYYFLIITPVRFRFYGGCNVQFSFYDFVNGNEVNHRDAHYVKKPSCRYENQDTIVLNSLFDHGRYLSFNETTGILSFFDPQKKNIMEFTTTMPKTRDILPISN